MAKAKTTKVAKSTTKARTKSSNSFFSRFGQSKFGTFLRKPLVLVTLGILLFSGIGTYFVIRSEASVPYLSQVQCTIRGRIYTYATTGNPCSNQCYTSTSGHPGAGYLVYAYPYNYCSAAVSKASQGWCDSLNRRYVAYVGCARYWPRINNAYNVPMCKDQANMYYKVVSSGWDYCQRIP